MTQKRLLKIGKARDVEKRLKQLQTASPYGLYVLATIKCRDDKHAFRVEHAAHEVFRAKRVRQNGEWFMGHKRVLAECLRYCHIAEHAFVE